MFGLDDIVGGIGSMIGGIEGQGDRDRAAGYYDSARQGYEKLDPAIQARLASSSAGWQDPQGRAAQMDALSQLQNQYRSGGLDALTRARMNETQGQASQLAQQNRGAVADQAARQGMGNSATSLMQQQLAGQQGANLAANQGYQTAALAQQGRMQALGQAGQLAGGMRGQDYERAAAQDAISRFNANQQQNAQQQTFGNAYNRAGGIAGAYGQQANQANQQADQTQRMWAAGGRMVGGIANAVTGMPGGGGGGAAGGGVWAGYPGSAGSDATGGFGTGF